jgi:hypothetical protein
MFGRVGSLLIATHSDDGGRSIGLHVTHVQVNSTELIEMPEQIRKLACSIAELSKMSGVGRSFLYEEIKARRRRSTPTTPKRCAAAAPPPTGC